VGTSCRDVDQQACQTSSQTKKHNVHARHRETQLPRTISRIRFAPDSDPYSAGGPLQTPRIQIIPMLNPRFCRPGIDPGPGPSNPRPILVQILAGGLGWRVLVGRQCVWSSTPFAIQEHPPRRQSSAHHSCIVLKLASCLTRRWCIVDHRDWPRTWGVCLKAGNDEGFALQNFNTDPQNTLPIFCGKRFPSLPSDDPPSPITLAFSFGRACVVL
jgi:hypothetical protein